jgi:hypothetical protein
VTGPRPRRAFDWDAAGRELGESLDGYHALAVVGVDPVVTGRVAVAIARAQAVKRRVALGDLFAESPPIQALVSSDDPHGLVDSFLYGVSLSRIAYQVPDAGELFVMPSGTEPPQYEEILPNPRWHRLAEGFREVGALLVLAVPASAERIEDLVRATDGAILVGDGVPRALPVSSVITAVREPRPESVAPAPKRKRFALRLPARGWKPAAAAGGIVLTLALGVVAWWLATRPLNGIHSGHTGRNPDTTKGLGAVVPAIGPDTAVRASAGDSATAVATITLPTVVNPGDSAQAAAFGVELMAANTESGAILKLQKDGKKLPAATYSPVLIQGARWYKVICGAFPSRTGADSLLASLRRQKMLDSGSGSVVRLPFAFRIDSGVPAAAVPELMKSYADRGQPVYALRQNDGTAWLLVGAFESIDQSALYAESLRSPDVTPVLVYRKGRTF